VNTHWTTLFLQRAAGYLLLCQMYVTLGSEPGDLTVVPLSAFYYAYNLYLLENLNKEYVSQIP
jgi:hypothetical protein